MQVVIRSGFWGTFRKGDYSPGLDLNKHVRDIMRDCGYTCLKCDESDCSEKDILNTDIREEINSLKLLNAELVSRIEALENA